MGMRSLRNWLLHSTRQRVDRNSGDGIVLMESPELRQMTGAKLAELTSELRLAEGINAATVIERHAAGDADDPEPRVFITCGALGGAFRFTPEAAERRIRKSFPDLGDKAVKASIRHLADRVVIALTSKTIPDEEPRSNWVHGWAD